MRLFSLPGHWLRVATWAARCKGMSDVARRRSPPPPTSGGLGDLNVTWDSRTVEGTTSLITWYWDPVDGTATYEVYKPIAVDTLEVSASPCSEVTWSDQENAGANRERLFVMDGQVALLCVRPKAEAGEAEADPSWAYASVPNLIAAAGTHTDWDGRTRLLTFTGVTFDAGFSYAFRRVFTLISDPMFDPQDCEDGIPLESLDTDVVGVELSYEFAIGLTPYTRYGLCYRAENSAGMSAWSVSTTGGTTLPAAPPVPQVAGDSFSYTYTNAAIPVRWTVITTGHSQIPRRGNEINYDTKVIKAVRNSSVTAAICADPASGPAVSATDTTEVFTDAAASLTLANHARGFSTSSYWMADPGEGNTHYYSLCIRAKTAGHTEAGPWSAGGRFSILNPSN